MAKNKNKIINFRVTEGELDEILIILKKEEITLSDYLRQKVFKNNVVTDFKLNTENEDYFEKELGL